MPLSVFLFSFCVSFSFSILVFFARITQHNNKQGDATQKLKTIYSYSFDVFFSCMNLYILKNKLHIKILVCFLGAHTHFLSNN